MPTDKIVFDKTEYTLDSLDKLDDGKLLLLRNLVAENLGVARIKSFKDHKQAVAVTWKALEKWDAEKDQDKGASKSKKAKATVKKDRPPAKAAGPQVIKRPTKAMFATLQKIKEHPGKGHRIARWDNYKNGMTLLECAEADGLTPLDVGYYVHHGLMKLTEASDAEFEKGLAAFYKRHGLTNPAEAKAKAKAEREAIKAEKAKEREAKKAEREKAKKAKAEEKGKAA